MVWTLMKELGRKSIHLFSIVIIAIFLYVKLISSQQVAMFVLVLIFAAVLFFEFLRLDTKIKPPIIAKLWTLKRKKESAALGGDTFYVLGIIIPLAAFDIVIAITAILMLVFGDTAAALIGKNLGKHKIYKKKTWEGLFAGLFANLLVGFVCIKILRWMFLPSPPLWIPIIAMAVTASLTELFVDKIDDNLAVPVMAGVIGQILFYLV